MYNFFKSLISSILNILGIPHIIGNKLSSLYVEDIYIHVGCYFFIIRFMKISYYSGIGNIILAKKIFARFSAKPTHFMPEEIRQDAP